LRIKQQKTDRRLTHIVPERLHVGVEWVRHKNKAFSPINLNSLTVIGAHERQLFDKLLWWLVTSTICDHCYCLIARMLAKLFCIHRDIWPFYATCCFDELSWGSVSCRLNTSFGKRFHNATTQFLTWKLMTIFCRGNTGQKIAWWRQPVASRAALDLPCWAMRPAPYHLIRMAIEMACKAFYCQFYVMHNRS
jgi:ribosomal protein L11 methylase PrmA